MSSNYLDASNINMITRLLREARRPNDPSDLNNSAARFLVQKFNDGTCDESRLRIALKQFIVRKISSNLAVQRWDNEGGAAKRELT